VDAGASLRCDGRSNPLRALVLVARIRRPIGLVFTRRRHSPRRTPEPSLGDLLTSRVAHSARTRRACGWLWRIVGLCRVQGVRPRSVATAHRVADRRDSALGSACRTRRDHSLSDRSSRSPLSPCHRLSAARASSFVSLGASAVRRRASGSGAGTVRVTTTRCCPCAFHRCCGGSGDPVAACRTACAITSSCRPGRPPA
jgi:hypothetical protein